MQFVRIVMQIMTDQKSRPPIKLAVLIFEKNIVKRPKCFIKIQM